MSDDDTLKLNGRFDEVVGLLGNLVDRVEKLEKRQADLDTKVDSRLHETRPIWEQVLSRLTSIEERLQHIEERQESVDRKLRWLSDEFKDLKVRVRPVFRDVDRLLTDRDDFEEGILKLEGERS
jgi:chromosome segregation ATPase